MQVELSAVESSVIFLRVCNSIIYPVLKKNNVFENPKYANMKFIYGLFVANDNLYL